MASSAPGTGTHSSGAFAKSSRSSLIVPSRSRMMSFIGAGSVRHQGQIGHLVHVGPGMLQQYEAIVTELRVVDVDHDLVEKSLRRRAQRRQRGQGLGIPALPSKTQSRLARQGQRLEEACLFFLLERGTIRRLR